MNQNIDLFRHFTTDTDELEKASENLNILIFIVLQYNPSHWSTSVAF